MLVQTRENEMEESIGKQSDPIDIEALRNGSLKEGTIIGSVERFSDRRGLVVLFRK